MAEASAPASAANLGPAFDSLGLALDLRCRVVAEPAAVWTVRHVGVERPQPGEADAVLEAARRAVGEECPVALSVESEIPVTRGLGSSAAAAAAAAAAAWRATGEEPKPEAVFELVREMEGHPDNAAAAVYGGLVAAGPQGEVMRLELHPSLVPVVAVPHRPLRTGEARRVLPDAVPLPVAVRSVARAIALVEGLRTADMELLASAGGDELHEIPRAALHPLAGELMAVARRAGACHACWSGGGPSVLALTAIERRPDVVAELAAVLGDLGRVLTPEVDHRGLE